LQFCMLVFPCVPWSTYISLPVGVCRYMNLGIQNCKTSRIAVLYSQVHISAHTNWQRNVCWPRNTRKD